MNYPQINACANRISDQYERHKFIDALERAQSLQLSAAALRRQAWARYRELTGLPKKGAKS